MDLTTFTTAETMDSREIAERTGKNHAHVCRDIQEMLQQLGEDESNFGSVYLGGNGERRRCYHLPKRESLILASGYSIPLRAKIIDRWAELEAEATRPKELSRLEILRMALESEEKVQALEAKVAAAAPAVEFVDRYTKATGSEPLRVVAKLLKISERRFVRFLEARKIMYRLGGKLTPFAQHVDAGRFEVTPGEANGHAFAQARFTPEGIRWVSALVGKLEIAAVAA